ncbi:MAG TPA: HAD family phosphatase [Acetobacteraceae bacterium]|nr:HAD family phosphatase [Acetobacteraceae bacterium]
MTRAARPAAVLFDCDGVLADSEAVVNAIVAEELSARGWPMTAMEAQEAFLGLALPDMIPRIEARIGALPPDWGHALSRQIASAMEERTMPVDGAVEAVRAIAAAGIPVAVASNSARQELAAKLHGLGLAAVFGARAFSFEDVDRPKPWPDLYRAAAEACGAAPRDCVVIEDSVPGVRAGRAAGCRVFGFAGHLSSAVLAAHGAEPFGSMAALPGLLGVAAP